MRFPSVDQTVGITAWRRSARVSIDPVASMVDATSASTARKRLGSGSTVEAKGKETARLEASSCESRACEVGR
jgi:hypothetical protein